MFTGNLAQFNPEFAVAIYCDLKILAATLVSRFCSLTYLWICLRRKIAPTARFATVFYASPRRLLQNLGWVYATAGVEISGQPGEWSAAKVPGA